MNDHRNDTPMSMDKMMGIMMGLMSKEEKLEMVTILIEQGWVGLTENEKKDFVAKIVEKVKA